MWPPFISDLGAEESWSSVISGKLHVRAILLMSAQMS